MISLLTHRLEHDSDLIRVVACLERGLRTRNRDGEALRIERAPADFFRSFFFCVSSRCAAFFVSVLPSAFPRRKLVFSFPFLLAEARSEHESTEIGEKRRKKYERGDGIAARRGRRRGCTCFFLPLSSSFSTLSLSFFFQKGKKKRRRRCFFPRALCRALFSSFSLFFSRFRRSQKLFNLTIHYSFSENRNKNNKNSKQATPWRKSRRSSPSA